VNVPLRFLIFIDFHKCQKIFKKNTLFSNLPKKNERKTFPGPAQETSEEAGAESRKYWRSIFWEKLFYLDVLFATCMHVYDIKDKLQICL
jgi:hypothetical protein